MPSRQNWAPFSVSVKKVLHIALLLFLVVACGPRKIEREDMEEIFYQMLIQDQQLKQDPALRRQADTMLVYEGIFREFGYNTDDFLYSLEYYLAEPARMEKVMENVSARLGRESKEVKEQIALEQWRTKLLRIYNMTPDTTSLPHPRVRTVDTLVVRFGADSVHAVLPPDSLPAPPRDSLLFVRDTL